MVDAGDSEDRRRGVESDHARGRAQLSAPAGGGTTAASGRRRAATDSRSPVSSTFSDPEAPRTPSTVDQCSCMALHGACPMQRLLAAHLDARTRSVSARPCHGTPPFCPMQELSRTPQTRPINDKPPTQTCCSAACAYAKRRDKRRYLVAGAPSHFEPPSPPEAQRRWSGRRAYAAAWALHCSMSPGPSCGPQKPN